MIPYTAIALALWATAALVTAACFLAWWLESRALTAAAKAEDAINAAEYDRARGYDRPISERSREAYRQAIGAPAVKWPPR